MSERGQRLVAVTLLSLLLSLVLATPLDHAEAASLGQWTQTTSYPMEVAGDSCSTYSGYVYCLGGFDSDGNDYGNSYYASISPSGIGSWSPSTSYPAKIDGAACVTEGADVYCIGGENATNVLANVYTTTMSSSGLGAWSNAAAYPQTIAGASCVVYSGYVYCVGGFNVYGEGTSMTYYASISSGITSWLSTTAYPIDMYTVPCVVQGSDIYCFAGEEEGSNAPNVPVAQVYYAPLSPSGIGTWSASTVYPQELASTSCVSYSGYAYCMGGYDILEDSNSSSYTSALMTSGVGAWTRTTPYPLPFDVSSCVADYSNVYCIAGRSNSPTGLTMLNTDYYAPLGVAGANTTSSSVSSTTSTTSSTTSTTSSSTTVPEFPSEVALQLVLAAGLSVVAILGLRKPRP